MHKKKKQRTGQHDPTRTSCPHPTQLCPWATIWPDISPRPTSPAHALRYCGQLGQEKLKWLNIKKVTSDKVKILCASRHLVCTHQLNSSFSYKFLSCYTVSYYVLQYDIVLLSRIRKETQILSYFHVNCTSSAQSKKKHKSYLLFILLPFRFQF